MGAPITEFEIIESIRFFGQLIGTQGLSTKANDKANEYIEKLLEALQPSISECTAKASGITLLKP